MIGVMSYHRIHQVVNFMFAPYYNKSKWKCCDCGCKDKKYLTVSCNNKSYLPLKKNFRIRCWSCQHIKDHKFKRRHGASPLVYFFDKRGSSYYLKEEYQLW